MGEGPAKVVVDALVIGVTGTLSQPDALVLAHPDPSAEQLRAVGFSVSVRPGVRAALTGRLRSTGDRRQLAGVVGGLPGHPGADYVPVEPTVLVEVEADPLVEWGVFRHRPRVLRIKAVL